MKKITAILAATAILCAWGCSSMNTVERANPQSAKKMVDDKRVITDGNLDDIAFIAGVNETRTPTGLLKIQVELVNRTEAVRNFNYCFEWVDAQGMQIASPAPVWITSAIDAGESKYVSAVAPSPNAVDFRLKLLGNVRHY